jgi:hypothetical protein
MFEYLLEGTRIMLSILVKNVKNKVITGVEFVYTNSVPIDIGL